MHVCLRYPVHVAEFFCLQYHIACWGPGSRCIYITLKTQLQWLLLNWLDACMYVCIISPKGYVKQVLGHMSCCLVIILILINMLYEAILLL